ncbi:hypothetical protein HK105_206693 [Polyrhizophydium stewartii]|uniref:Transcription factor IIIC 90kDa subunit N-terminal domain-containing protein n=1 Tax=Polyrhizophydium stewartii TaxID=2732419 RepID=A0ABR4N2T8_9FUNG
MSSGQTASGGDTTVAKVSKLPPALGSAVWSAQNQLALTTAYMVHLFCPVPDGQPAFKRTAVDFKTLTMDRTSAALPLAKSAPLHGELANVAAWFSQGETFRRCVWSPVGLSSTFGCVLLALTSTFRLAIIQALTDPETGDWDALDMTPRVVSLYKNRHPDDYKKHVQTTTIAWSAASLGGVSLMAFGSSSGWISIWSVTDLANINNVLLIESHAVRVSCLELSDWIEQRDDMEQDEPQDAATSARSQTRANAAFIFVAAAGIDGSVRLHKLEAAPSETQGVSVSVAANVVTLPPANGFVTVIRFAPNQALGLFAVGRGKMLFVCSDQGLLASLSMPTWEAVADVVWAMDATNMRVYTTDGECLVVSLSRDQDSGQVGAFISQRFTRQFEQEMSKSIRVSADNDSDGEEEGPADRPDAADAGDATDAANAADAPNAEDAGSDDGEADDADEADEAGEADAEAERKPSSKGLWPWRIRVFGASRSYTGVFDAVHITIDRDNLMLYKTDAKMVSHLALWMPGSEHRDALSLDDLYARFPQLLSSLIDPVECISSGCKTRTWEMMRFALDYEPDKNPLQSEDFQSIVVALEETSETAQRAEILGVESLFHDYGMNASRMLMFLFFQLSKHLRELPESEDLLAALQSKPRLLFLFYLECMLTSLEVHIANHVAATRAPDPSDMDVDDDSASRRQALALTEQDIAILRPITLYLACIESEHLLEMMKRAVAPLPQVWESHLQPIVEGRSDVTETCPACGELVVLHGDGETARVTLRIVTTPVYMACTGCQRRRLYMDSSLGVLPAIINRIQQCVFCGDRFRPPLVSFI